MNGSLDAIRDRFHIPKIMWLFGYAGVFLIVSLYVLFLFLTDPGINNDIRSSFPYMVYGEAARPFVTRALVPWTIRGVVNLTPAAIMNHVGHAVAASPRLLHFFAAARWEPGFAYQYLVGVCVIYLFLLLYLGALALLAHALLRPSWFQLGCLALLGLVALPPMFVELNYIYDFGTLFFTTLLLYGMASRRMRMYWVCFALACFNKETAILLTGVYFLYFVKDKEIGPGMFWGGLVYQVGVWGLIRFGLRRAYAGNRGITLEHHLDYNLRENLSHAYALNMLLRYLVIAMLCAYGWSAKPRLLRIGLLMLVPLLVATLFFGWLQELRDYYETLPVIVLLAFHTFVSMGKANANTLVGQS